MPYSTYIVRCADDTLYTGWTTDVKRRVAANNGAGPGAKYTRTRRPVVLAWSDSFPTKHEAMHWEAVIKGWPKAKKEALCSGSISLDDEQSG